MTSTEVAQYRTDAGGILGIDEVDAGDMVAPRLSINHNRGVWVNSLNDASYNGFTAILLCRVKQRAMWKEKLTDKADPQCKSNDFHLGFPNENPKSAAADLFPWDRSVFQAADYPVDPAHNGLRVLPCANCNFKQWSDDDRPPCKEMWTFAALVFLATAASPDGEWCPMLFSIQGTGIPSVRPYISTFIQRGKALFTQMTTVSLKQEHKAGNDYYVPVFAEAAATDPAMWPAYGAQTQAFMDFLKQDPRGYERGDNSAEAITSAPVAQAPQIPAATEPAAQPVSTPEPAQAPVEAPAIVDAEVVEEPVSNPPVAPATPAPATPAPAQPAAPVQPAPAAPAPAEQVAPSQPTLPAQPAPAAPAPAAPEANAPATVGPGKLPF